MTAVTPTSSVLTALAACILSALTGCAANNLEPVTAAAGFVPAASGDGNIQTVAATGYERTAEEHDYDCKRLTGRLQIRILELRSRLSDVQTSALSRSLNTAGSGAFGGTHFGLDPKSDRVHDIAQIKAFNDELMAKKCRSFDLAKALTGTDLPPSPTVPAPSSK